MKPYLLNLQDAPSDPVERLIWLGGALKQAQAEVDAEFQKTYFKIRQQGMLDYAINLRLHSVKRILAFTRAENEARGRSWRWGDHRS